MICNIITNDSLALRKYLIVELNRILLEELDIIHR